MELQPRTKCIVCAYTRFKEFVSMDQIRFERIYLDNLFRRTLLKELPEYMFKDHIHFIHTYEAGLVFCEKCGAIYRDPCMTPQSTFEEYTNDDYHEKWLEAVFEPYSKLFLSDMPRLIAQLGNHPRVLEVGSQVGGFQFAAKQYGWDVRGVDIGIRMSEFARSKGLDVITGRLMDAKFPDAYFDAVFVWSCFEMIPNPWLELQEIRRVMRDNGKLYITIPNGAFIKHIQPFLNQTKSMSLRETLLKLLAYSILLGFSFQVGYTPSNMRFMLKNSGFQNICLKNLLYVPITSSMQASPKILCEKKRYIKITHYISQVIRYLTFGNYLVGPWIEIEAEKV